MRKRRPEIVAALFAAGVVLSGIGVPLMDDDLFWWTPKGLLVAEYGPQLILSGELPTALESGTELPRQWSDGLPDYGHPPLWFWWLGLWLKMFGPHAHSVHLAVLPMAAAVGWGLAALMRRLGGLWAAWGALAVLVTPPLVVQLWRGDTDAGLLAFSIWALLALVDGKWGRFAVLAVLATWIKEPGVLLLVPAVVACVFERRWRWEALAPAAALGIWGGVHYAMAGWAFAGAERLPSGPVEWLSDVISVSWLILGDQGRFLIWPFAAWAVWKGLVRVRPLWIVGSFAVVQIGFFGTFNFLGGIDRDDAHTHVRYLVPGSTGAQAVAISANPWAGLAAAATSIWHLKSPHSRGPEASLCAAESAIALKHFAESDSADLRPLWVGSYAYTQLTQPFAGVVEEPLLGLSVYGPDTDPSDVQGHVLSASFGEPLGRLQELKLVESQALTGDCGGVRLLQVKGWIRPGPESAPAGL